MERIYIELNSCIEDDEGLYRDKVEPRGQRDYSTACSHRIQLKRPGRRDPLRLDGEEIGLRGKSKEHEMAR